MCLAAYGYTETDWHDRHANPETDAEINGVHIPMPDYTMLDSDIEK